MSIGRAIHIAQDHLSEIQARLRWAPSMRARIFGQGCVETAEHIIRALERARDSDGSGEAGETRSGSTEGDSAGLTEGKASPNVPRDPRGFTPWEHEPDEFDRDADEDCRPRDDLDDMDDDDFNDWMERGR